MCIRDRGYIDLLARLTGDKRQELYLRNMKGSSEHLLALVNSLLDFYRLDINKIEVCCVAFSPAQLFETIRAGFAAAAAAKGLELRLEAEPAAAGEVSGDALHIRQIADNLISNALKFTDEGSVTLRVDVVRGRLVFSVRDTGRGIGREERERIFAEFVRLSSAQGVDGFGLGLSIVDRLVKLLDGTISLESRLGEGSKDVYKRQELERPVDRLLLRAVEDFAAARDGLPQGLLLAAVGHFEDVGAVAAADFVDLAREDVARFVDQRDVVADLLHRRHVVRREDDRRALVAQRQDFVFQQIGVDRVEALSLIHIS